MIALLLSACAPTIDMVMNPTELAFGDVDFALEMPEEGYAPLTVSVTNEGGVDVVLTLIDDDDVHLCVQGFTGNELPLEMGTLSSGSTYVFNVAVCRYEPGERDSEVVTAVELGTDSEPDRLSLAVTFTPVRTIDDGT